MQKTFCVLTVAILFAVAHCTFSEGAEVKVRNDSRDDIRVSMAVCYTVDDIGNIYSYIDGGWTVRPGDTIKLLNNRDQLKSLWLAIDTPRGPVAPRDRPRFVAGPRTTYIARQGRNGVNVARFVDIPPDSGLEFSAGPGETTTVAGRRVQEPPPRQVHFLKDNTSLWKAIVDGKEFVFFKVDFGVRGGAYVHR